MLLSSTTCLRLWVLRISCARKHRRVVLDGADDTWVVGPVPNGWFEDYSLIIPFALTLGFDAIRTSRTLFAALDTAFATGQATSLGPLTHFGSGGRA
jgi:hypothetical protein